MCPQYPQIPQSHERERIQCVGGSVGRRHLPFVHDMNEEQSLQLSPQKSVDLTTRQIQRWKLPCTVMCIIVISLPLLQFLILCSDISVVWCLRFELFLHSAWALSSGASVPSAVQKDYTQLQGELPDMPSKLDKDPQIS